MICEHWTDGICGNDQGVRVYLQGPRCQRHTPAVMAGRADYLPDPSLTLDALRDAAGVRYVFRLSDTALNDERAIASGRRRATPEQYKAARQSAEARKAK